MVGAVFVVGNEHPEHWRAAIEAGFWEAARNPIDVEPGDPFLFWMSGESVLGVFEATHEREQVVYSAKTPRPWSDTDEIVYEFRYRFEPIAAPLPDVRWSALMAQLGLGNRANSAPFKLPLTLEAVLSELAALSASSPLVDVGSYRHRRNRSVFGDEFSEREVAPTTSPERVFTRDPQAVDRGLVAHEETLAGLARWLLARKIIPTRGGAVNYDLAWETGGRTYVAEIKSLREQNELNQIRLGIGEVLDFAHQLGGAVPILAVEREPVRRERWDRVCREAGITLVWPAAHDRLEKLLVDFG